MTAYTFRMPSGVAGDVTRTNAPFIIETQFQGAHPVTAFGAPVFLVAGKVEALTATQADGTHPVYGISVRSNPTSGSSYPSQGLGSATPNTTGILDILREGYINVKVNEVVAAGDAALLAVTGASAGQLSNAAGIIGTPTTIVVGKFTGPADAFGNAEIFVRFA
jgi:hypothetical protein